MYANAPFASWSELISEVKPTADSSRPKRAYGGSRRATTPVPTNERQTIAVRNACADGFGAIRLTAITKTAPPVGGEPRE